MLTSGLSFPHMEQQTPSQVGEPALVEPRGPKGFTLTVSFLSGGPSTLAAFTAPEENCFRKESQGEAAGGGVGRPRPRGGPCRGP